jgi:subtilisin family serine protease
MSRPSRRLLALVGLAAVLLAGPSAPATGSGEADDPVFTQGLQWGLERIGAPQAWAAGRGGGITIAIIDSGMDLGHVELADKVVRHISCVGTGGDTSKCKGSAQDDNGHGTHVAGIAAASTNNSTGIAGVAPDAQLMAVRVLVNECGSGGCTATGTAGDVAAGIRWAVDNGADIINLSLGGGTLQGVLGCAFCNAIEYAWANGVIAVIAAGNDSLLPTGFGDEPAVVVTATTRDDGRASYSNASSGILRGARWPVSAPGGEGETTASDCATGGTPKGILSTYWIQGETNAYACLAGTSMAAPHVAGSLAVLRSQGLDPQQAIDRLIGTVRDLGPPGSDSSFGAGRIDLARAAGPGPATTTTSSAVDTTTPTDPPATATTGVPTTIAAVPVDVDPNAPADTLPSTEQAAQFGAADEVAEEPGSWLVVFAVLALFGSGSATALTAWQHTRRGQPSR